MRKDPSNPRYTKVEVRVGHIIREVIRLEVGRSDSRSRGQYGNNRPRKNYRDNNF